MIVTTDKCVLCAQQSKAKPVCKSLTVKINMSFPLHNCYFWKFITAHMLLRDLNVVLTVELLSVGQMFFRNNAWVKSLGVDTLHKF